MLTAETADKLSLISAKMRGLAYLIESQRDEASPVDWDDVWWGVGELLNSLSQEIRVISSALDSSTVERAK